MVHGIPLKILVIGCTCIFTLTEICTDGSEACGTDSLKQFPIEFDKLISAVFLDENRGRFRVNDVVNIC